MSLPIWYLALAAWLAIIGLACLALPGECVELQISGNASGQGLHILEIGNNSTTILYEIMSGWNITTCPNTHMTEVRRDLR